MVQRQEIKAMGQKGQQVFCCFMCFPAKQPFEASQPADPLLGSPRFDHLVDSDDEKPDPKAGKALEFGSTSLGFAEGVFFLT